MISINLYLIDIYLFIYFESDILIDIQYLL